MLFHDLGTMAYRDAWAQQERAHESVVAGGEEQLLLVEHPPVITFGRRAETLGARNLLATRDRLKQLGVEVVQSDRGGDVTFHGPGQIVAYPIIRLNDHGLSVGGYVRALEEVVLQTLGGFAIPAQKDACAIGVWVAEATGTLSKICALGVRIRRGVSLHGIALNVETDLKFFNLIVPCGLHGRAVTSIRGVLDDRTPPIDVVKLSLIEQFRRRFTRTRGSSPPAQTASRPAPAQPWAAMGIFMPPRSADPANPSAQ